MQLSRAKVIADSVVSTLKPFCDRIEIAGSIRRQKEECGDAEVICIPKNSEILSFVNTVDNLGQTIKGDPNGRYVQIILPYDGFKLDLFIVRPENWGYQFAIRTGPADFSHKVLARGWKKRGYKGIDGMLTFRGKGYSCQRRNRSLQADRDSIYSTGVQNMKCNYSKPCEVKKPDAEGGFLCTASIRGYCGFQEIPETPQPVAVASEALKQGKAGHLAVDNGTMSQDKWIEQTKMAERMGHV